MSAKGDEAELRAGEVARATQGATVRHEHNLIERLPVYRLRSDALAAGPGFGNGRCWITTRGSGAVDGVFSTDLGHTIAGSLQVRVSGLGARLVLAGEHRITADGQAFVHLRPEHPGETLLHPASLTVTSALAGDILLRQRVFVPRTTIPTKPNAADRDAAVVYQAVEVTNRGAEPRSLRVCGFAQFRGATEPDIETHYDDRRRALMACNASHPEWVRVYGATVPIAAYSTTTDASQVYTDSNLPPLDNRLAATGAHVLGALQVDLELAPGEKREFAFVMAFAHDGVAAALRAFDAAVADRHALARTISFYRQAVRPAELLTPDAVINEGALWAKVNMLRVMADYPTGPGFTNDPAHSSAVVGRDTFWFVYGCDHLQQDFACALLRAFATRQEASGLIPEYYDAVTGASEDYGLNINDNTPLFILAVNHHWRGSGHRECADEFYPAVVRAARYILSQRDQRGLVWCTATGENIHGIIGWRNIIPKYRISGAVTEVNAECAAALRAAGHLAENLGHTEDARQFTDAARELTAAINTHLLNPDSGVYHLTLDVDGLARTDVTADEVFPVIFRVAPEDVGFRVVSRLNMPDFWTEAGVRTISADSPDYDPTTRSGLLGGVWPGVTWWYAFAASRYHPGAMVRALRASFAHYARAPKTHNTVPGQFSEWFDGESLVNRGMRLSPWEAPRYLWAAVEGIGGVMVRPAPLPPLVEPLLPAEWPWVGLRHFTYHGQALSYFAARLTAPGPAAHQASQVGSALPPLHFFASGAIEVTGHARVETFDADVTERVGVLNDALRAVAFAREDTYLICVGNTATETVVGALELEDLLDATRTYHVHLYNSERGRWSHAENQAGAELRRVAITVEAQGFRILRLRQVG
jgi:hypothetical protein